MSPTHPGARACRIGAPVGLFLARILEWLRQPILRVFDLNDPDRAELTGLHHGAGVTDQRIAGIIIGDSEDRACRADLVAKAAPLLKGFGAIRSA